MQLVLWSIHVLRLNLHFLSLFIIVHLVRRWFHEIDMSQYSDPTHTTCEFYDKFILWERCSSAFANEQIITVQHSLHSYTLYTYLVEEWIRVPQVRQWEDGRVDEEPDGDPVEVGVGLGAVYPCSGQQQKQYESGDWATTVRANTESFLSSV